MKITLELTDVSLSMGERLVTLEKEIKELERYEAKNNLVEVAIAKNLRSKHFSLQSILEQIVKDLESGNIRIISSETEKTDEGYRWF